MTRSTLLGLLAVLALAVGGWIAWGFLRSDERETNALSAPALATRELPPTSAPAPVETALREEARAEAASDTDSAVPVATVVVQVTDPERMPLSAARVVLFQGKDVLAAGTTDAAGATSFAAVDATVEYAIHAAGWMVSRGQIDATAGTRAIQLADDGLLAGTVTIDGFEPREPVLFQFNSPEVRAVAKALPSSVLHALDYYAQPREGVYAMSGPHGQFSFRGLPSSVTGSLQWLGPYFLPRDGPEAGRAILAIDGPNARLRLELVSGVELGFRVVDLQGEAIPFAEVRTVLRRSTANSSSSFDRQGKADAEGRYRERLTSNPPPTVEVTVGDAAGNAMRTHVLPAMPVSRGAWDAGDLPILNVRSLVLQFQDQTGAPVAGASAALWPSRVETPERSGEDGRLIVETPMDEPVELLLGAYRFRSQIVTVPARVPELAVVLESVATLEVELSDFDGPKKEILLRLSGPSPVFVDFLGQERPGPQQRGAAHSQGYDPTANSHCEVEPDADGRWKFAGILPGRALHASLVLSRGSVLAEADVAPLAAGEVRVLTLHAQARTRKLDLRVTATDGAPILMAAVDLIGNARFSGGWRNVGADGRLTLEPLIDGPISLVVSAAGFSPREYHRIPIPQGVLEVVLGPAASIEVALVHSDGRPYTVESRLRLASASGYPARIRALGEGRFQVEVPSAAEVTLEAFGDFGAVRTLHDTRDPLARLVVDGKRRSVSMHVASSAVPFEDHAWSLAAAVPGAANDSMRAPLFLSDDGSGHARIELALGAHELWLERRLEGDTVVWQRVGVPLPVTIEAGDTQLELEWNP